MTTESIEKHYFERPGDGGITHARAVQAAELGWLSYLHGHPYGEGCNGSCRKVAITP